MKLLMKLLNAILDIALFVVLTFLSFDFVHIVFSPTPGQAAGMGASMSVIFFFPVAILGIIIGLVKYRLWRDRLFWVLLGISAFAVFAGSQNGITVRRGDVSSALFLAALFAPMFAVPLWQLVTAVFWGARSLKG